MPHYMITGGYSPESWQRMMEHHEEDRAHVLSELCQQAGGRMETFYWTFGSDDYVFIADLPDNATAAGLSVAISSTGEVHDQHVTTLMTQDERNALMEKGRELASHYRRPGG